MRKFLIAALAALCITCGAAAVACGGSGGSEYEDLWEYASAIVAADTYAQYADTLDEVGVDNGIFETSLTELQPGGSYYYVLGVLAQTSDGIKLSTFEGGITITVQSRGTGEECEFSDNITITNTEEYGSGEYYFVEYNPYDGTYIYNDTDLDRYLNTHTGIYDFREFNNSSSCWVCYVMEFTVTGEEVVVNFDAEFTGTKCKSSDGVVTGDIAVNSTAEVLFDERVSISTLNVRYVGADDFNYGDFAESALSSTADLTVGGSVYVVVDFVLTPSYDADVDKINVMVGVSPSSYFTCRVTDAMTSTISSYTSGDFNIVTATYTMPEHEGETREERLIVQVDAYLAQEASIVVYFYGEEISVTDNYRFTDTIDTKAGASVDLTGHTFELSSDKKYYTLTAIESSVTDVVIPALYLGLPVTGIATGLFKGNTAIKSVTIGDNVTEIESLAFSGCTSLTTVTIGKGVTSIGAMAFDSCTALTTLNYNAVALESPGEKSNVFYNAGINGAGITVNIGADVTELPDYLFYVYAGWPKITFQYSAKITSVIFADGSVCGDIGTYAFYGCTALESVALPDSLTWISETYVFGYCTSLTSVTLPEGLGNIPDYTFYCCTSLVEVVIPDSVSYIGKSAFYGCSSLEKVTIGSGVTTIREYAFQGCESLESAVFKHTDWILRYYLDGSETEGHRLTLNDESQNAEYLRLWYEYYWYDD